MKEIFFLFVVILFLSGCGRNDRRTPLWQVQLKARAYADVIAESEIFYAFSQGGEVIAAQIKTGKAIWKRTLPEPILGTPAFSVDSIFVATHQGAVVRLRKKDGSQVWEKRLNGPFIAPVAIFNSLILIPSESGTLYALDSARGSERWKLTGQKKFNTRPVVEGNRILIGGWEKQMFSLKEDGSVDWQFHASDIITEDAVVFRNVVFFGSYDHFVYALEVQTGKLIWRHPAVRPSNLVILSLKRKDSAPSAELVFASGTNLVYVSPESGKVIRVSKFGKIISRLYANGSDLYVVSNNVYRINPEGTGTSLVIDAPHPIFKLTFATGMILALDDLYSIYGYARLQD